MSASDLQTAEIVRADAGGTALQLAPETAALFTMAVQQNLDLDKLERIVALHERAEERQARKEFFAAMAAFQSEVPPLGKDSAVDFQTSKGRTHYRHASLGGIVAATHEALFRNGLSYRFEIQPGEGGLSVTCIVTHKLGHSEKTTMGGPADDSGSKNPIQSLGSTVTYMQRYTLIAALGLVTADEDTDGRPSMTGPAKPVKPDPVVPDDWPPAAPKSAPAATEEASQGGPSDADEDDGQPDAPEGHPFAVGGEYEAEVTYVQPETRMKDGQEVQVWKKVGNSFGKWVWVMANGVLVKCKTLSNPAGSKEAGPWAKGSRVTFSVTEVGTFADGTFTARIEHVRPV